MDAKAFDLYEPVLRDVLSTFHQVTNKPTSTGQDRFRRIVAGRSARTTMLLQGSAPLLDLGSLRRTLEEKLVALNPQFHLVYLRVFLRGPKPYLEAKWTVLPIQGDEEDSSDEEEEAGATPKKTTVTQAITSFLSSKVGQVRKAWRKSSFLGPKKGRKIMEYNLVFPEELALKIRREFNLPTTHDQGLDMLLKTVRCFQGHRTPVDLHLSCSARFDSALNRQVVDIKVRGLTDVYDEEIQSVLTFMQKQGLWDQTSAVLDVNMGVLTFGMHVKLH